MSNWAKVDFKKTKNVNEDEKCISLLSYKLKKLNILVLTMLYTNIGLFA